MLGQGEGAAVAGPARSYVCMYRNANCDPFYPHFWNHFMIYLTCSEIIPLSRWLRGAAMVFQSKDKPLKLNKIIKHFFN